MTANNTTTMTTAEYSAAMDDLRTLVKEGVYTAAEFVAEKRKLDSRLAGATTTPAAAQTTTPQASPSPAPTRSALDAIQSTDGDEEGSAGQWPSQPLPMPLTDTGREDRKRISQVVLRCNEKGESIEKEVKTKTGKTYSKKVFEGEGRPNGRLTLGLGGWGGLSLTPITAQQFIMASCHIVTDADGAPVPSRINFDHDGAPQPMTKLEEMYWGAMETSQSQKVELL